MDIKITKDGHFLFCFNHVIDKERVLEGCPWNFDKDTLILRDVGKDENPKLVDLDWCASHVHIHNLPIRKMKMTKEVVEYIGNHMGNFVDVAHMDSHWNLSSSLKMRVLLNVRKPLM
ncbi:hypothetical protein Salat_1908300 [Sesamum alatum]|uniref:DUF4283 domain-containing protein n=1 Tax=Sesamum alatum TaxID=300844 RepID=A0AAE1Y422_9LAMI|nr:hypothetical protein Salat_1908300 [Sesamum alatum]